MSREAIASPVFPSNMKHKRGQEEPAESEKRLAERTGFCGFPAVSPTLAPASTTQRSKFNGAVVHVDARVSPAHLQLTQMPQRCAEAQRSTPDCWEKVKKQFGKMNILEYLDPVE